MKRLFLMALAIIGGINAFSQISTTATVDRLVSRRSIFLRDWWIDSIQRDTAFTNRVRSIPTSEAVRQFVEGRLSNSSGPANLSNYYTKAQSDSNHINNVGQIQLSTFFPQPARVQAGNFGIDGIGQMNWLYLPANNGKEDFAGIYFDTAYKSAITADSTGGMEFRTYNNAGVKFTDNENGDIIAFKGNGIYPDGYIISENPDSDGATFNQYPMVYSATSGRMFSSDYSLFDLLKPNLQRVTDGGNATTNTITAAGYNTGTNKVQLFEAFGKGFIWLKDTNDVIRASIEAQGNAAGGTIGEVTADHFALPSSSYGVNVYKAGNGYLFVQDGILKYFINGATYDVGLSGVSSGVASFNNRTGYITPQSSDYSSFFYTKSLSDGRFLQITDTTGKWQPKGNYLTSQVSADWNASSGASQILNKPTLATVATTGNYNDLSNRITNNNQLANGSGYLKGTDTISINNRINAKLDIPAGTPTDGWKIMAVNGKPTWGNDTTYIASIGTLNSLVTEVDKQTTGIKSINVKPGNGISVDVASDSAQVEWTVNADLTPSSVAELTNKRITLRTNSVATTATLTPNADNDDIEDITALAGNLTINAPTGSPRQKQRLIFSIRDNGSARSITWNSKYQGSKPTTTTPGETLWVGVVYDQTRDVWDVASQPSSSGSSSSGTTLNGNGFVSMSGAAPSYYTDVVQTNSSQTLTNKDISSATNTYAFVTTGNPASSTQTVTGDRRQNELYVNGLSVSTSIGAPTGTPSDGNKILIRIVAAATGITVGLDASFNLIDAVLPSTLSTGQVLYIFAVRNTYTGKWDVPRSVVVQ